MYGGPAISSRSASPPDCPLDKISAYSPPTHTHNLFTEFIQKSKTKIQYHNFTRTHTFNFSFNELLAENL